MASSTGTVGPKVTYTPAYFQDLCGLKVADLECQLAVMQVAMDIMMSPTPQQREELRKTKPLHHVAGTGRMMK